MCRRLKFNPIYLVSDPAQKWKLLAIFLASLTPFLGGALFLGCVFLKSNKTFGRVYFADLAGSGLSGLVFLGAMYLFNPVNLIAAPLGAVAGGLRGLDVPARRTCRARVPSRSPRSSPSAAISCWRRRSACRGSRSTITRAPPTRAACRRRRRSTRAPRRSASCRPTRPPICISRRACPTTPASICPTMPANAYMGLYIDSDGPIGVMRHLTPKEEAYFRYLPMYYPYVIKKDPKVFVAQFGGGISTEVALAAGAKDVTVAEGNRAILAGLRRRRVQEVHRRHSRQGACRRLRGPALPRAYVARSSTSST